MYKVLIIDDEEPVREAVKILGMWEKLGVGDILEAGNGKEGMHLMEEARPDIVFVDMNMPEMNGVEFLQKVEKKCPDTQYIVISGYKDYEYSRQALKSRAIDYLLKPVNRIELNHALMKAIENNDEKRKKQSEIESKNIALNISLQSLKEKYLYSAIEGKLSRKAYEEYIKIVGEEAQKMCYSIAVLRIMNLEEVNGRCFHHDFALMYLAVANVIHEMCSKETESFTIQYPKSRDTMIILLYLDICHREEIKCLSYELMMRAIRRLENLFGIVSVAGIGTVCFDFVLLSESYHMAYKYMNSINLLEMRDKVINTNIDKPGLKIASVLSFKKSMEDAIENGSREYSQSIISEYLQKVADSGYFSLGDAVKTLNEFVQMMRDIAVERGEDEETANTYENNLGSREISYDYTKFDDFKKQFYGIADYFYMRIQQRIKSSNSFHIQEIKDFIERNYSEDIKISFFTDKYFLSREYLMKLFKKEFGYGIHEYILRIRMEKAKELMKNPRIKVQNIAQMLGYNDNNYFSKAFKNYYGISPTNYRMDKTTFLP